MGSRLAVKFYKFSPLSDNKPSIYTGCLKIIVFRVRGLVGDIVLIK
jgi:hypothetical protein